MSSSFYLNSSIHGLSMVLERKGSLIGLVIQTRWHQKKASHSTEIDNILRRDTSLSIGDMVKRVKKRGRGKRREKAPLTGFLDTISERRVRTGRYSLRAALKPEPALYHAD
jgi:hypothetical protein